jgi:putative transposase
VPAGLTAHLAAEQIKGSVGDVLDNALLESTIGLQKTELIKPQRPWKALSEVELATAEWADRYTHRRLHGETGHVPPAKYEAVSYRPQTNLLARFRPACSRITCPQRPLTELC